MITNDLFSLAPQFQFADDASANSIYGVNKGFGMMLKANEQTSCFIFTAWARKGALSNQSAEQWFSEYTSKPENSYVKATDVNNYTIAAVVSADADSAQNITRLTTFIYDITEFLQRNYYSNACAKCGSGIGLGICFDSNSARTQLCKMCAENEEDEAQQNAASRSATLSQETASVQPVAPQPVMAQPNVPQPTATIPQQTAIPQPQQTIPVAAVGVGGVTGIPQDNLSRRVDLGATADLMDSVDPATAPHSTGFTTAEDLAALKPAAYSSFANDYIDNDFRTSPSFTEIPGAVTPIARNLSNANVKSNPLMGFAGAVLFSLIACVIWVIFGMMGKIAWIGGLAMGFCTVTGYKIFGKKFDIFGIISCIVVIALAVLGSNIFIETLSIFQDPDLVEVFAQLGYEGFADVFFNYISIIDSLDKLSALVGVDYGFMKAFLTDLAIGYVFSGIGFCVVGIPAFKERNY